MTVAPARLPLSPKLTKPLIGLVERAGLGEHLDPVADSQVVVVGGGLVDRDLAGAVGAAPSCRT